MSPIGGSVVGFREIPNLAADWAAAVVVNGGSVSSGRETLVNALLTSLQTAGVLSKLDRLWVTAAENQQSALTDMIALDLATAINSPTFTTDVGYTGNGSSSYVDTTFNPNADGVQYTQNDCHYGVWVNSVHSASFAMALGGSSGSGATNHFSFSSGTAWNVQVNTDSAGDTNPDGGTGMWVLNRVNSSNQSYSKNGAAFVLTAGGAVGTKPNLVMFVDAYNGGGSPSNFATHQISAIYFGAGLSDPEVLAFYNAMRTYMTAVGVP